MDKLEYLEINHSGEYNKAIVFIHGWKGTKSSFKKIAQSFSRWTVSGEKAGVQTEI